MLCTYVNYSDLTNLILPFNIQYIENGVKRFTVGLIFTNFLYTAAYLCTLLRVEVVGGPFTFNLVLYGHVWEILISLFLT